MQCNACSFNATVRFGLGEVDEVSDKAFERRMTTSFVLDMFQPEARAERKSQTVLLTQLLQHLSHSSCWRKR